MHSHEQGRRHAYHPSHTRHPAPALRSKRSLPVFKVSAFAIIGVLTLWAGTTTAYILFRDEALKMLASRQTQIVHNYDGQIAALETQVQRLQSLKLVEQERVDRKVSELAQKQTVIEQRQNALGNLAPVTVAPSAPPQADNKRFYPDTFPVIDPEPMKPSPISDGVSPAPLRDRSSGLGNAINLAKFDRSRPITDRIEALGSEITKIETHQQESLDRYARAVNDNQNRALSVISELGLTPPVAKTGFSMGGPFIPFRKPDAFSTQLAKVQEASDEFSTLNGMLRTVPIRFPVPRRSEITSNFGARADPFFHALAFHSGLDFRGAPGEAVHATAAGRVTNADNQGGYGLMVEVDHGKGLVTRYGHLSAIDVNVGDRVEAGTIVGRVGTTGRSTGPHLHYEVRVSGEAVDPMRYLRAGSTFSDVPLPAVAATSSKTNTASKMQLISAD